MHCGAARQPVPSCCVQTQHSRSAGTHTAPPIHEYCRIAIHLGMQSMPANNMLERGWSSTKHATVLHSTNKQSLANGATCNCLLFSTPNTLHRERPLPGIT